MNLNIILQWMICSRMNKQLLGIGLSLSLLATTSFAWAKSEQPQVEYTQCQNPRPQMCTMDYNPVCAVKDIGIRCITTPCDSTALVTYANGCSACADERVLGYQDGACPE